MPTTRPTPAPEALDALITTARRLADGPCTIQFDNAGARVHCVICWQSVSKGHREGCALVALREALEAVAPTPTERRARGAGGEQA